jgi:hypothetical protein
MWSAGSSTRSSSPHGASWERSGKAGHWRETCGATWSEAVRRGRLQEFAWKPAKRTTRRPKPAFRAELRLAWESETLTDERVGNHDRTVGSRHHAAGETLLPQMRAAVDALPPIEERTSRAWDHRIPAQLAAPVWGGRQVEPAPLPRVLSRGEEGVVEVSSGTCPAQCPSSPPSIPLRCGRAELKRPDSSRPPRSPA